MSPPFIGLSESRHYEAWSYKKRSTKEVRGYRKICLERTYSYKMSVNSGFKATCIIGQRIPEFHCARKETVDIYILVTSRNGD